MTVTSELAADATFSMPGFGFVCLSTEASDHFALSIEYAVNCSAMAFVIVKLDNWDSCQTLQRVQLRHLRA
jgi:hypothetical protein